MEERRRVRKKEREMQEGRWGRMVKVRGELRKEEGNCKERVDRGEGKKRGRDLGKEVKREQREGQWQEKGWRKG